MTMATTCNGDPQTKADREFWKEMIKQWYPEYLLRPYLIPPVFMNKTSHQKQQFAGRDVYVPKPVSDQPSKKSGSHLQESDVRDDIAHVKVLRCLQSMSSFDQEVMFVISQLDFSGYLGDSKYGHAASHLPTPKDQGDFDVLIIHRKYGILAGEIKAIGDRFSCFKEKERNSITTRVNQAVKQLEKTGIVLHHIVSDQEQKPRIQKTLILPNVTTAQLHDVLSSKSNKLLFDKLCQCLAIAQDEDPVQYCLTSDTLTNPDSWWQQRMTKVGLDPAMTDQIYLDLVSRFVGPASTVKVACTSLPRLHLELRTEGQAVAETGWRFTQLVLHPSQLAILNSTERLVFLTGPPGCGKTTVLYLKALDWLRQGKRVQVVSTCENSLAVSYYLFDQLQQTIPEKSQLMTFFNIKDKPIESIQEKLSASTENGHLFMIADEIESAFKVLFKELQDKFQTSLHIWAASTRHGDRPELMTEVMLTEPLRTPPTVTKEVEKSPEIGEGKPVYRYSLPTSPLPCEGPAIWDIVHSGPDHSDGDALYCMQCGAEVASVLQKLNAGIQDSINNASSLSFGDALLVHTDTTLTDQLSPAYQLQCLAKGLVGGLRQQGVPVFVLTKGNPQACAGLTRRRESNEVIATCWTNICGLEWPVVIFVEPGDSTATTIAGRCYCISRCTAFLIWVRDPRSSERFGKKSDLPQKAGASSSSRKLKSRSPETNVINVEGVESVNNIAHISVSMIITTIDEIHRVLQNGSTVDVNNILVSNSIIINKTDQDGRSALHHVCSAGDSKVVEVLLQHGADIDMQDKEGKAPLYLATSGNHEAVISCLLEHGSEINLKDNEGKTALWAACSSGHVEILSLLLEHEADVNIKDNKGKSALWSACVSGQGEIVSFLLKHELYKKSVQYRMGMTFWPFFFKCDTSVLRLGHDIDTQDSEGRTALWVASFLGATDVVSFLLENGADPYKHDFFGTTPLWAASLSGKTNIVHLLLAHAARTSAVQQLDEHYYKVLFSLISKLSGDKQHYVNSHRTDKYVCDPVHAAAGNGHLDTVIYLIESGKRNRFRALIAAARNGQAAVVRYLVDQVYLVYFERRDEYKRTALHYAAEEGHGNVVEVLIANGAWVQRSSNIGRTPLMDASREGHSQVVKQLVEAENAQRWRGFDEPQAGFADNAELHLQEDLFDSPELTSLSLNTPLLLAMERGHTAVVHTLLSYIIADKLAGTVEKAVTQPNHTEAQKTQGCVCF